MVLSSKSLALIIGTDLQKRKEREILVRLWKLLIFVHYLFI